MIIVISNNEVKILMVVRRVVELLKRLKAAPLFLTRVKFKKCGIRKTRFIPQSWTKFNSTASYSTTPDFQNLIPQLLFHMLVSHFIPQTFTPQTWDLKILFHTFWSTTETIGFYSTKYSYSTAFNPFLLVIYHIIFFRLRRCIQYQILPGNG